MSCSKPCQFGPEDQQVDFASPRCVCVCVLICMSLHVHKQQADALGLVVSQACPARPGEEQRISRACRHHRQLAGSTKGAAKQATAVRTSTAALLSSKDI